MPVCLCMSRITTWKEDISAAVDDEDVLGAPVSTWPSGMLTLIHMHTCNTEIKVEQVD